jgi:ABC-2 type transport system ATP-binding protein
MLGVDIDNLGKRFGDVDAVRGISLAVQPGEVFGLLGPNGAGKTTTLSMLSTLLRPSYGDATIFGKSVVSDVRGVRQLVGLAPQEVSLYPNLTAQENLDFFGRLYSMPHRRLRARADELLALVGLTARSDERVDTYSGGMKRRLNLACGLVHEPRLLLLDEPTVGVDPQSRDHILAAVRQLAQQGLTILYTTHYMEEAERFCDRIAIMDEGRIVAAGTLPELLQIVGMGEVIEIAGAAAEGEEARLRAIPGVTRVETTPGRTRLVVANARRALVPIADIVADRPDGVETLDIHPVNLERVFLQLTGKELRD